jgi:predicted nucleic acid-binding protein
MAMTLRLTPEEEQILERLALQLGTSKQKALIEAMRMVEQQSAKKRKLDDALQFVLTHDKELMQRLADA